VGWVWSGRANLAPGPGPLGSVAGDPDRHRGWPAPLPLLPRTGACRPGLRPRVFSAHRPVPQLQVQDSVMGWQPILWQSAFRPEQPSFTSPFPQSGRIL
jgi:hypothetical protein